MKWDILIRGGEVIDPSQQLRAVRDVAIQGGLVAEVGEDLPAGEASCLVDARGLLVTPGLIDL
ncbi:MAG: D-glutamate deacylase, partial [Pirellulaceae bacterium]